MKLIVVVLNRIEYLDDLLSAFLEIGVTGASTIDSVGMGRILSHDVPIFAGLRSVFPGTSPGNKTIFTVVHDELVDDVLAVIDDVCGNFEDPGTGMAFVVSVDTARGVPPLP